MPQQETLRPPSRIRAAETRVTSRLGPSSIRAELVREVFKIPEDIKGLNVVDLAAGTSSFVPWLIDNGANAFAVDCIYNEPIEKILERTRSYTKDALDNMHEKWRELLLQESEKAMAYFVQSFQTQRERYITAWLSDLPISDDFADITTSVAGLSTIVSGEYLLENPLIEEALRITKPGGKLLLSPVSMHVKDHQSIVNRLKRRSDISVSQREQTNLRLGNYPVLEVVKK